MDDCNLVHVWSFDPGQTTGWCHLSVHEDEIGIFNCGEADHFQVGNMLYDNPALKAAVKNSCIKTLFVVEKFTMSSKITPAPWSLETTGLIRYFSNYYNIPFHLQTPSQAKNLVPDSLLKKLEIYVPGQGHAMDATRHAVFRLLTKEGCLKKCLK